MVSNIYGRLFNGNAFVVMVSLPAFSRPIPAAHCRAARSRASSSKCLPGSTTAVCSRSRPSRPQGSLPIRPTCLASRPRSSSLPSPSASLSALASHLSWCIPSNPGSGRVGFSVCDLYAWIKHRRLYVHVPPPSSNGRRASKRPIACRTEDFENRKQSGQQQLIDSIAAQTSKRRASIDERFRQCIGNGCWRFAKLDRDVHTMKYIIAESSIDACLVLERTYAHTPPQSSRVFLLVLVPLCVYRSFKFSYWIAV